MSLSYQELLKKAQELKFPHKAFINGNYVDTLSGQTFPCISPRDGKILAKVASCDKEDVDIAVKCAREAFDKGIWANLDPLTRKRILLKFADLLEKHALELALMETLDMGKPITDSFQGNLNSTIASVRWMAECIDKLYDRIAPTSNHYLAMLTREPCGIVGCITPWNFPLHLACHKAIAALAVGNSVILKPAEQSPLTALRMAALMQEAGLPDGVLNIIPGFGETAGQAIGRHPDIDVLSFTGSTEVGRLCLKYSAESNMKRVYLECGGKSPNIIMGDYADLEKAAKSACRVFFNQGEVCCAPTRLLVDKKIHDTILSKLLIYSDTFTPGDPLDPETKMGALVDNTQMDRVLNYIHHGQKEGAKLTKGGKRINKIDGGYYIEPTIFTEVKNEMKIAREEIFGPVLTVIAYDDLEQAIKIANDSHYGLAAYLWTNNLNKAHKTAKALRAGVVAVNCMETGNSTTAFGGYKQSGIGREGGLYDFDNFSEIKTTWISFN